MRNSKSTQDKKKLLKEQQKVLRNKLIPDRVPAQVRASFGTFSMSSEPEYRGKSLRQMKKSQLQKKQKELKNTRQKRSLMYMFK